MSQQCEICDEEVSRLYECEECGILFCKNCGLTSDKICADCSEEQTEEEEDWE